MVNFVLFGLFAIFLLLTIPIGVAIGLCVLGYVYFTGGVPIEYVVTGMFSGVDSFPIMAIPFFILSGALMEGGGLSKRLVGFADSFVGHFTGGLAIVTVVTCMFFGAISGSGPATVAAIGTVMVPTMIEGGYSRKFSIALVAASGCLGVIIPPSIPMVMYGVATNTSISSLFMGGFLPGILCGTALIIFSVIYCKRAGFTGNGLKFSFARVWKEFKSAIFALISPLIILGGIYGGFFTPTEAGVVSVLYAFFTGLFIYKELTLKNFTDSLVDTSLTTATIMIIVATGAVYAKALTLEHIPQTITATINAFMNDKIVVLLVINLFLLVVGMLMDTTPAILILAPILLPIVQQYNVDPIHFGLIMVINLAIGFITPPVGVNLFVACGIAEIKFEDLAKAIIPFIIVLFIALMIITYVPGITMFLPNRM